MGETSNCKRQMSEEELEPCDECNATGNLHYACEVCEGNGWVGDPSDGGVMACPECGGEADCPECNGEGYL